MNRLRSIRVRAVVTSVLAVALFGALLGLGSYLWIAADLEEGLRSFASHEADELSNVVASAESPQAVRERSKALAGLFPEDGVVSLEVWTPSGELVVGLPAEGAPILGPWPEGLRAARAGHTPWARAPKSTDLPPSLRTASLVRYGREPRWVVTAAVRTDRVGASLDRLLFFYALGLPVLVLLTGVAVSALVGRVLSPVHALVNEANVLADAGDSAEARELSGRLHVPPAGSELAQLVELINRLLERTSSTVDRLRKFTAHAGHELRTPLSRLRGEVELALRSGDPEDMRVALEAALEEVEVQCRVLDALLELAHEDDALDLARQPAFDLRALLEGMIEEARALGSERALEVGEDLDAVSFARGNRALVARALWNLLDNALKYTPEGGAIRVELRRDGEAVRCTVENDLAPGEVLREELFEAFARGDSTQSSGHGLGLALSRAVARRHGGSLKLAPSGAGRARLVLTLQATDAPNPALVGSA